MWHKHTLIRTPRTYKLVHRTGCMKQTQPGKEKGHPQAFCISTTVSDISLAKQSGMDVCLQDFSCFLDSRSFPKGLCWCPAFLFIYFSFLLFVFFLPRKLIVFMVTSLMLPSTRLMDEALLKHPSGRQFSVVLSGARGRGRFCFMFFFLFFREGDCFFSSNAWVCRSTPSN